jgi:hypothetical protein
MELPCTSYKCPKYGIVVATIKSSHEPMNLAKEPSTKVPHPSSQLGMYIIQNPLHRNDIPMHLVKELGNFVKTPP